MANGYVYILVNRSMPGLIKIGRTKRDCSKRARELQSTGVPTPFDVAFEIYADDHEAIETKLLNELSEFRVSGNREFFNYPIPRAIKILISMVSYQNNSDEIYAAESIFSRIKQKYSSWVRQEITNIRIVQTAERVWLEVMEEEVLGGYLKDQLIRRTDLGFCCLTNGDVDENYFSPTDNVSINADKFVTDWDPWSIVMTTNLFSEEACHHIANDDELNPNRKKFPKKD